MFKLLYKCFFIFFLLIVFTWVVTVNAKTHSLKIYGPITQEPSQVQYVQEIAAFIRELPPEDTVQVRINSSGGSLYTGFFLLSALQATEARTVAFVDGYAGSMAAFVLCYVDEIELYQHSSVMFHTISWSYYQPPVINSAQFSSIGIRLSNHARAILSPCVEKGLLTQKEIDSIIDGKEIYKFGKFLDNKPSIGSKARELSGIIVVEAEHWFRKMEIAWNDFIGALKAL